MVDSEYLTGSPIGTFRRPIGTRVTLQYLIADIYKRSTLWLVVQKGFRT